MTYLKKSFLILKFKKEANTKIINIVQKAFAMFSEEFSKVKKELESLKSDIIGILSFVILIKL